MLLFHSFNSVSLRVICSHTIIFLVAYLTAHGTLSIIMFMSITGLTRIEAGLAKKVRSFIATVCALAITLFLFPELTVLERLVVLEHFQHYSGQIKRDEEEDINF